MFREGTALEALESADSRRFLPQALVATLLTIVVPALVVVALSPLSGIADLALSALLATGLSVAAGSAGAALWTRSPQSREIPFGDLMLWSWARRVRAERRLARAADDPESGGLNELGTLRTLAVVFEAREGSTHGHSGRVARHAERIARRMGLPDDEVDLIEAAAAVHDVGMLGVPQAVLSKDEADRSPEERALVRRHVVEGAERLEAIAGPGAAVLVRHHHERVDGGGYPDGLAGDEIPLGARIVAVADRFDELLSPGARQAGLGRRNALDELRASAGSELDAAVVAAFVGYYSSTRAIAGVAFTATAPQRAVRWLAAAPGATLGAASAPVAVQSMCAAGATVLAGACLSGLPALAPEERGGGERPAEQSADRPAGGAADDSPTELASAAPPAGDGGADRGGDRGPARERGDGGGGSGDRPSGEAPRTPATQAPGTGGTPTTPQSGAGGGGGGTPPGSGGGGGGGSGGGGGTGTTPATPVTPPSVETPHVPSTPPPQVNPVTQVVDPVLDGVGEAVPPVKPVTETLKGVVGGLTGGLVGGGR